MVSRPSVVTVSSFGRQKLIENMMRVSVYAFKQIIISFLKECVYVLLMMCCLQYLPFTMTYKRIVFFNFYVKKEWC